MATRTAKKKKAKAKASKQPARPSAVDYMEVDAGRRNAKGELVPLFARVVRDRDDLVSATLGSSFEKLQIRVTLAALRAVVKKMESLA